MSVSVSLIAQQLFDEVRLCKEQHGHLTDDLLSVLHFIFHQPLLHALDLIDRRHITRLVSPSDRTIHQVAGSTGQSYTCLLSADYCTCPSYTYTGKNKTTLLGLICDSRKNPSYLSPGKDFEIPDAGTPLDPEALTEVVLNSFNCVAVLVKMESFLCKHLLAAHLAEALDDVKEKTVTDQDIVALLSYDCDSKPDP